VVEDLLPQEPESVAAILKRIDDRTALVVEFFKQHAQDDRADFKEVRAQLAALPERAAEIAQRRVDEQLTAIGIDLASPTEHQKDQTAVRALRDMMEKGDFFEPLASVKRWRDAQDTVKRAGIRTATGVIVLGVLGAMWAGFADKARALLAHF
jgi:myo-inositol catabolism protein IolC